MSAVVEACRAAGRTFLLLVAGAGLWMAIERFNVVDASCLVTKELAARAR